MMRNRRSIVLLAVLLVGCTQQVPEKSLFEKQMDHALALAQQFGPITESVALQVAEAYDGVATDINYIFPNPRRLLRDVKRLNGKIVKR